MINIKFQLYQLELSTYVNVNLKNQCEVVIQYDYSIISFLFCIDDHQRLINHCVNIRNLLDNAIPVIFAKETLVAIAI